jgi:hypothetical protein
MSDRPAFEELKATALDAMKQLDDEDRLEIMGQFCKFCGSDNPNCQCWNEEMVRRK